MDVNPYQSPASSGLNAVEKVDPASVGLPALCVVCGRPTNVCHTYVQDYMPIILPGSGFVRSRNVTLPYCEAHESAFRRRFWWLRAAQNSGYVACIGIGALGSGELGDLQLRRLCTIGFFALVVCLAASIFVIKPLLYDVFITPLGNRFKIRGACYLFCNAIADEGIKHVECV